MTFRPADQLQPHQTARPNTNRRSSGCASAALIYPYEIIKMLTPAREHDTRRIPARRLCRARSRRRGHLVPVDRPYGQNKRQHRRRRDSQLHDQISRGHDAGHAAGRSQQGSGSARRARMPAHHCRPGSGSADGSTSGVVHRSQPGPRSRWTAAWRTWTGSPVCCAA